MGGCVPFVGADGPRKSWKKPPDPPSDDFFRAWFTPLTALPQRTTFALVALRARGYQYPASPQPEEVGTRTPFRGAEDWPDAAASGYSGGVFLGFNFLFVDCRIPPYDSGLFATHFLDGCCMVAFGLLYPCVTACAHGTAPATLLSCPTTLGGVTRRSIAEGIMASRRDLNREGLLYPYILLYRDLPKN